MLQVTGCRFVFLATCNLKLATDTYQLTFISLFTISINFSFNN
jgi:hypothetical protein